jgi:NTP pyrophosphatase (non-canonical NTP hydrolase)
MRVFLRRVRYLSNVVIPVTGHSIKVGGIIFMDHGWPQDQTVAMHMEGNSMNLDQKMTVDELKIAIRQFNAARHWDIYHSPKNLAMSVAIEAAEIMEHFQWGGTDSYESLSGMELEEVRLEIADVAIYLMDLCNRLGIDLSSAITDKIAINNTRFPKPPDDRES